MEEQDLQDLQGEVSVMQNLHHPNIVKMIELYSDNKYFYLVSEFLEGGEVSKSRTSHHTCFLFQLLNHLNEDYAVSEKDVQNMTMPLFDAVLYCHDLNIIHRDLKPENLLLTSTDLQQATLKIADFGLARFLSDSDLAKTVAGSPSYIAPEILNGQPYDCRCDYWSLGVILFLLLSGGLPFEHEDHNELFQMISEGEYKMDENTWHFISEEAKHLV